MLFARGRLPVPRAAGAILAVLLTLAACGGDETEAPTGMQADSIHAPDASTLFGDGSADAPVFASKGPYPAFSPDAPQVRTFGGPVLANPKIVPVFWPGDPYEAYLTGFLQALVASPILATQTAEYGVGPATLAPAAHVPVSAPAVFIESDEPQDSTVESWLVQQLDDPSGPLPPPDGNTVYVLYFPLGTTIGLAGDIGIGCQDFSGYHQSVNWHGVDVAYAAMPRCLDLSTSDGEEELTAASSHEIVEAATDPYPFTQPAFDEIDPPHGYYPSEVGGTEIADMCELVPGAVAVVPGLPYVVQRTWSNAAALGGHDPCVPAPDGPYFGAAPVLPDESDYTEYDGVMVHTKAVHIEQGQTKTIDIQLFSDGPTDGPWGVYPLDDTSIHGDGSVLDFQFEHNVSTGSNGDVLHLAITVRQAVDDNVEGFWIFSDKGGRVTAWLGVVTS